MRADVIKISYLSDDRRFCSIFKRKNYDLIFDPHLDKLCDIKQSNLYYHVRMVCEPFIQGERTESMEEKRGRTFFSTLTSKYSKLLSINDNPQIRQDLCHFGEEILKILQLSRTIERKEGSNNKKTANPQEIARIFSFIEHYELKTWENRKDYYRNYYKYNRGKQKIFHFNFKETQQINFLKQKISLFVDEFSYLKTRIAHGLIINLQTQDPLARYSISQDNNQEDLLLLEEINIKLKNIQNTLIDLLNFCAPKTKKNLLKDCGKILNISKNNK